MRYGLLGGTFDPIHLGHLRSAEEIYDDLKLDHVIFIPAAIPPHKDTRRIIPFFHRFRMVDVAIKNYPHFSVSDIEERLPGKSYSVETLRYLRKIYGKKITFYFIMGLDEFFKISSWKDYRELFKLSNFVVISRPGYAKNKVKEIITQEITKNFVFDTEENRFFSSSAFSIYTRETTLIDISSTKIREHIKEGKSIRFLVPNAVYEYIYKEDLYLI